MLKDKKEILKEIEYETTKNYIENVEKDTQKIEAIKKLYKDLCIDFNLETVEADIFNEVLVEKDFGNATYFCYMDGSNERAINIKNLKLVDTLSFDKVFKIDNLTCGHFIAERAINNLKNSGFSDDEIVEMGDIYYHVEEIANNNFCVDGKDIKFYEDNKIVDDFDCWEN